METAINIGYGTCFKKTRQAYRDGNTIIIHKGGTGSGKTEDIIIFLLFQIALVEENKIITIVSESRPHLEIGAIRIMKKHLKNAGHWDDNDFNKVDARYTHPETGSIIEFFSADRLGKALGARRDWLFGNEINHIKLDIWEELARRSHYVIGDFNPTAEFWLEQWLADYDKWRIIKTNYLDNPFCPDFEAERIKIKADRNENFRRTHIDCEYGRSEGVVFTEWEFGEFDESLQLQCYGQDYGFSADPTTLVRVGVDKHNRKIYLDEKFALAGLSTAKIAELNRQYTDDVIIADSAEPRLINELKKEHKINVRAADKGPGSITAGVTSMQDYTLIVTEKSYNLVKELRNYIYLDKGSKIYIDDYNHSIDAARYAFQFLTKHKQTHFTI